VIVVGMTGCQTAREGNWRWRGWLVVEIVPPSHMVMREGRRWLGIKMERRVVENGGNGWQLKWPTHGHEGGVKCEWGVIWHQNAKEGGVKRWWRWPAVETTCVWMWERVIDKWDLAIPTQSMCCLHRAKCSN
jgi:hypothetical protein